MLSTFHTTCLITKVLFVVAFICLLGISGMLFLFSGFLNLSEGKELVRTMFCGGIYTAGSAIILGEKFSILVMTVSSIFLNILGAVFWVPSLGSNESYFAVFGIVLTILSIICIILRFSTNGKTKKSSSCL
jgi:hypothetical protein